MLIGYLKLSPSDLAAGVSEPHNQLIASGVQRLFIDVDLGAGQLPQLESALAEMSAGDALVSPSVNTLTGSIAGLLEIHGRLEAKGLSLRVLKLAGGLPLDTATVEGRAILGALAVMSLLPPPVASHAAPVALPASPAAPSIILGRDTVAPRPRGRPATAVGQAHEVTRLRAEGVRAVEIAACLGIGRASVYRILSQGHLIGGRADDATDLSSDDHPVPALHGRFGAFTGR